MIEEKAEVAIKVVVVGNGTVGKSSLIQRFCRGEFTSEYKKTIGVDFLERELQVKGGRECRLMVWDTAGQEEFQAITRAYYRGAQVCIIVFSTVDRDSFISIAKWKNKVDAEVDGVIMCVVQNKIDLIDEACMTSEEVDTVVKELKLKLFRTSVKENFNVDTVFQYLAVKYLEKVQKDKPSNQSTVTTESVNHCNGHPSFQIRKSSPHEKKKGKTCSTT